jgi:hypothetical protein
MPGLSTIYDALTPDERDALAGLGCAPRWPGYSSARTATPMDSHMIVTPGALEELVSRMHDPPMTASASPPVGR